MVRVGITCSFDGQENKVSQDYVRAVEQAGGIPILLPTFETLEAARAVVGWVDALVVTGGPGICETVREDLPEGLSPVHPSRSQSDRWILEHALARNIPILGICYGMQLLNVLDGGTLFADVEREVAGALPHSPKRGATTHPITIMPATRLHDLLGSTESVVNSFHFQAIEHVGSHYNVSARSLDGTIEAIEHGNGLILGVQFHPERMGEAMISLFEDLVSKASPSVVDPKASNLIPEPTPI